MRFTPLHVQLSRAELRDSIGHLCRRVDDGVAAAIIGHFPRLEHHRIAEPAKASLPDQRRPECFVVSITSRRKSTVPLSRGAGVLQCIDLAELAQRNLRALEVLLLQELVSNECGSVSQLRCDHVGSHFMRSLSSKNIGLKLPL